MRIIITNTIQTYTSPYPYAIILIKNTVTKQTHLSNRKIKQRPERRVKQSTGGNELQNGGPGAFDLGNVGNSCQYVQNGIGEGIEHIVEGRSADPIE